MAEIANEPFCLIGNCLPTSYVHEMNDINVSTVTRLGEIPPFFHWNLNSHRPFKDFLKLGQILNLCGQHKVF
jgi:hypothetical protein